MLGSLLSRTLLMVFGYAYPAYECFKIVESNRNSNKSETENLLTWCQYWILVAMFTVFERIGDFFLSWLPLYSEAKLGFLIYLWSYNMKGMKYIYGCFFQPFMTRHEDEIDRNILEIRSKAGNFAIQHWKKALIFCQTKFLEILQSMSSNDSLISRPAHIDQEKTQNVSSQIEAEETSDTEKEQLVIQEDIVSHLESNETKTLQQKNNLHKEANLVVHGKWRKRVFTSS